MRSEGARDEGGRGGERMLELQPMMTKDALRVFVFFLLLLLLLHFLSLLPPLFTRASLSDEMSSDWRKGGGGERWGAWLLPAALDFDWTELGARQVPPVFS